MIRIRFLAFCVVSVVVVGTAHASDHIFTDWGNSDSARQCLAGVSVSLSEKLGIKSEVGDALVEHALEIVKVDLGPYSGKVQWRGEIRPDAYLDHTSVRKMKSAEYDCTEKLKTDGTWRWVWVLVIWWK